MSDDGRIDEIRKRCELATDGPWFADCHPGGVAGSKCYRELIRSQASYPPITIAARPMRGIESGSSKQTFSDMQFIANARQDIPFLLEHIAAAVADAVRGERNRICNILSGRLDFAQLAFERSGFDKWGNDCETYRELIHEIERHIKQQEPTQ